MDKVRHLLKVTEELEPEEESSRHLLMKTKAKRVPGQRKGLGPEAEARPAQDGASWTHPDNGPSRFVLTRF